MPDASPSTTLCTSCALCCTGALHRQAFLYPDEIAVARDQGLDIVEGEQSGFALPCPKLIGSCCSIFATRPRVCGGYKCQLLLDLESGEIGLHGALGTVATAQGLAAKARNPAPDETSPAAAMQKRLHRTGLAIYLDKYFMNSTDRKILEMTVVATPAPDPET